MKGVPTLCVVTKGLQVSFAEFIRNGGPRAGVCGECMAVGWA
jgi:hypothetical protein